MVSDVAKAEIPQAFVGYTRGRQLGHGASGLVFACARDGSGEAFAVKVIDLRRLRLSAKADREFKKLQREVDILKRVPAHPNLVRFVDAVEEGHFFMMIMECVEGGDLFSALMRRGSGPQRPRFSMTEAAFVLRQLVDGLGFLHKQGVIHRDLKLENVLVTHERQEGPHRLCSVKITDFGLSKVVGEGLSDARSTVGSPRYIAPEVLSNGVHDFRADLWSLGILLYVLLAGRFPADGLPEVQQSILDAAILSLDTGEDAKQALTGMLQVDREKRITLAELRASPLLTVGVPDDLPPPAKRPRLAAPEAPAPGREIGGAQPPASEASLFGSFGSLELIEGGAGLGVPTPDALRSPVPSSSGEGADKAAKTPSSSPPAAPAVVPPSASPFQPEEGAKEGLPPREEGLPPREEDVVPIRELDRRGSGGAVQGTIRFRCDHKTGGGFHIRIGDASGEIDVRFWEEAARRWKSDASLCRGSLVRFAGFYFTRLQAKDKQFAPADRLHNLNYNRAEDVRFEVVPVTVA